MTDSKLTSEYMSWMKQLVCPSLKSKNQMTHYQKLLDFLNTIDFKWVLEMDSNRAEDGVDLRYRFGQDRHYDQRYISERLDVRPCSVLEMLISLAVRCEEHIMSDPAIGDRTDSWFWLMIENLGLICMMDSRFDPDVVRHQIFIFLERKYKYDGSGGGLFVVKYPREDMRRVEIWYQLCWYLDEIIERS